MGGFLWAIASMIGWFAFATGGSWIALVAAVVTGLGAMVYAIEDRA